MSGVTRSGRLGDTGARRLGDTETVQPLVDAPFSTRWGRLKIWVLPVVASLIVIAGILVAVIVVVYDQVVVPDEATNSLVTVSSLRDYAQLRGVIDQLDRARLDRP